MVICWRERTQQMTSLFCVASSFQIRQRRGLIYNAEDNLLINVERRTPGTSASELLVPL
jgi:hypothetical protein